jgi:hypothetical protein
MNAPDAFEDMSASGKRGGWLPLWVVKYYDHLQGQSGCRRLAATEQDYG